MHLHNLDIDRLPGIKTAFSITAGKGVNLILGPNESGKSSLVRTVMHLLWPSEKSTDKIIVARGSFTIGEEIFHADSNHDNWVSWQKDDGTIAKPALPRGQTKAYYKLGVLDLMRQGANDEDRSMAQEIRRRMDGGYDLDALGDLIPDPVNSFTRKHKIWIQNQNQTEAIINAQKALSKDQNRLEELHQEVGRATIAKERMRLLQSSIKLEEARLTNEALEIQLSAFPTGMKNLIPNDADSLGEYRKGLEQLQQQHSEQEETLIQKNHALADLNLSPKNEKCQSGVIAEILKECRSLQVTEQELARALAGAETRWDQEKHHLDPRVLALESQSLASPQQLFQKLARLYHETMALEAALHQRQNIARETPLKSLLADDGENLNKDRQTSEIIGMALDDYFVGDNSSTPTNGHLLWGGIALVAGVAGCLLPLLGSPESPLSPWVLGPSVLAALAGGALMMRWWARKNRYASSRTTLETICKDAGHPLPAVWTSNQARELILPLKQSLCQRETTLKARQNLQKSQNDALALCKIELQQAEEQRQKLLEEHHLPLGIEQDDLLAGIGALDRYLSVKGEVENFRGKLQECRRQISEAEARARHEFSMGNIQIPDGIDALADALDQLEKKRQQSDTLSQSILDGQRQLKTLVSHQNHQQQQIQLLLERLDLLDDSQPDAAVSRLVKDHDQYLNLQKSLETNARHKEHLKEELAKGVVHLTNEQWQGKTIPELSGMLESEKEIAAKADVLIYDIATIDSLIKTTRNNRELADARAEQNSSLESLVDLFEARNDAALAQVLVQTTESDFEEISRPQILEEASRLFSIFTGFGYQLRVTAGNDKGAPQVFQAFANDGSRRALSLEDLSDGTRAQLLLAARLAFIKESESEVRPPIFLDESLTSSDPQRFAAIAASLATWSQESSRQIFYLTSNPADVAAWFQVMLQDSLSEPHFIDLGAIRTQSGAADPASFKPATTPTIIEPGDLSAEQYGRLLQVPKLDPWAGENAASLFYLLDDDLKLLHRLYQAGITTLGRWRVQPEHILKTGIINSQQQVTLEARGQILGAFLEAWLQGRGRLLDAISLKSCNILSGKMLKPAQLLLATKSGNARAFMEDVHDGKVKRLKSSIKEELQNYLELEGYIDNRPQLDSQLVINHIVQAVAGDLASGTIDLPGIRSLTSQLVQVLNDQ